MTSLNEGQGALSMELDIDLDMGITPDPEKTIREVSADDFSGLSFFKGVEQEVIDELVPDCQFITYDASLTVLGVGQLNPRVYFLIDGQLQIKAENNATKASGIVDVDNAIGVLSALDGRPSGHAIVAAEKSEILAIDPLRLMSVSEKSHVLSRNWATLLVECIKGDNVISADGSQDKSPERRITYVDSVTGVHNNRWLERGLSKFIMRHSTNNEPLSLAMVDVDKFTDFKEEFGEDLAGQVLCTISQVILDNARPTDSIVRYKDDIFVVILPGTDLEGARAFASRLREAIAEKDIEIPNECVLPPVQASAGITTLSGFVSDEIFLQRAQEAMMKAKEKGGNWVAEA